MGVQELEAEGRLDEDLHAASLPCPAVSPRLPQSPSSRTCAAQPYPGYHRSIETAPEGPGREDN